MGTRRRQRGEVTAKSLALFLGTSLAIGLAFRIGQPRDDALHYRQPGGSLAAQSVRWEMIQMFVDNRIIVSMKERDTILRLEVTEGFQALEFARKQEIASVVCAYWATENEHIRQVTIHDAEGRMIGRFSPTDGGLKLE
jgi:hypothetical protein